MILHDDAGTTGTMSDASDHDALEQAQTVGTEPAGDPPRLDPEVPEADALEQSQEVPEVEDDYNG